MPRSRTIASALALALALAACSGGAGNAPGGTTAPAGDPRSTAPPAPDAIPVTAAFYPLEYLLTRIGGEHLRITTLTKPGAEPHDLELNPADVAGLGQARLVVTLGGFQPAVDRAVAQQPSVPVFDAAAPAQLTLDTPAGDDHAGEAGQPAAHPKDPHFWLDPIRYGTVGTALAERLAEVDPAHAADYRSNARALTADLQALDASFRTGLASCSVRQVVTSHAAFTYLTDRYGLTQVPIAGLSPDQEPTARQLAQVAQLVRDSKVTTIYAETLVDARFADTVATSTGARIAVLDPVEGITDTSPGRDYPEVMQANLAALRAGQGCR